MEKIKWFKYRDRRAIRSNRLCARASFRLAMALLVRSGLAKEIVQDDGTARRYAHELTIAQCSHVHLVCKDCGAAVEHKHATPIPVEEGEYAEKLT